jgi:acetolactate synthase small subunit
VFAADFKSQPTWCFSVFAAPEPGVMPRVLEFFAKRGLVPSRVHGEVVADGPDGMVIDVHVASLAADVAEHIAACLRELVDVERVLTAVKRRTQAAAGAL